MFSTEVRRRIYVSYAGDATLNDNGQQSRLLLPSCKGS